MPPIQPGLFGRRPQVNFARRAQALGLAVFAGWQSDCGIVGGTGLAGIADQSGNSNDLGNVVGTAQPLIAPDATLNGMPAITFDGVDDQLLSTVADLPAPPVTIYTVFKHLAWVAQHELWSAGTASNYVLSPGLNVTPQLVMYNGTLSATSSGATVGSWCRAVQRFTNSTADSLKLGSAAAVTGTNCGGSDPAAGYVWGKTNGLGNFARMAMALQLIIAGTLSGPSQAALDALVAAVYGPGVLI